MFSWLFSFLLLAIVVVWSHIFCNLPVLTAVPLKFQGNMSISALALMLAWATTIATSALMLLPFFLHFLFAYFLFPLLFDSSSTKIFAIITIGKKTALSHGRFASALLLDDVYYFFVSKTLFHWISKDLRGVYSKINACLLDKPYYFWIHLFTSNYIWLPFFSFNCFCFLIVILLTSDYIWLLLLTSDYLYFLVSWCSNYFYLS